MSIRNLTAHPRFLNRLLAVDATATGATALLLVVAATPLAPVLGLPSGLLRGAGLVLVPFVVFVAALAAAREVPRGVMRAVVAINVAWVAASLWVAFGGAFAASMLGTAFVLAQAAVVALFAEAGWFGLRARRAAPAVA